MLGNFVKLFLILHLLKLSLAQYCNEEIVEQKVIIVKKVYDKPELYRAKCTFPVTSDPKMCPFWKNVTITELEDKIEKKNRTIVVCCDGFHLVNKKDCLPYCKDPCINGFCSSPGSCSCSPGFTKSPTKDNICEPVCEFCNNGDCVAPNECKCHAGYTKNLANAICEPFCEDCGSGICTQPYKCKCNAGYEKDVDGKCSIKSCPTQCSGGSCIAGECECGDDLEWDFLKSACIPVCPTIPPTDATPEDIDSQTATLPTDSTTTEKSLVEDNLNNKDLLIWGLIAIIALLGMAIVLILSTIWWKKRNAYQEADTYNIRYETEQILIQAVDTKR